LIGSSFLATTPTHPHLVNQERRFVTNKKLVSIAFRHRGNQLSDQAFEFGEYVDCASTLFVEWRCPPGVAAPLVGACHLLEETYRGGGPV
jgi:hypothetical protein